MACLQLLKNAPVTSDPTDSNVWLIPFGMFYPAFPAQIWRFVYE